MKRTVMCFLVFASIFFHANAQQKVYYYYGNEKITLKELDDKIFIKLSKNADTKTLFSIIQADEYVRFANDISKAESLIGFAVLESKDSKAISAKTINKYCELSDIVSVQYLLEYETWTLEGPTDEFVIKLKKETTYEDLQKLALEKQCEIVEENQFVKNQFKISVSKMAELNSIQMANLFYETGMFEFSEPNFIVLNAFDSNYTYFNDQWGLKNTGQNGGVAGVDIKIESVWSIRQGNSNIKIAVIDHGVDLTHPDLQANLLSGYDASGNNSGGAPVLSYGGKDYHGTACAGIIAAIKDNNEGIAGIAPNCKIIPVHAVNSSGFIDKDLVANSIQWAWQNGADVMSLSWSSVSEYTPLTNAINTAVAQGRNGKGCILVFSTGNNSVSEVHFPAKLPNVIAVGSADRYGDRASSSNYGSALNVVAPGVGIYTTDLQGSAGYSSGNYHFSFSGTSAATPHVAGVAALVLSAHPNLTAEQVRQAIESTCTKLPNYTFSSNSTHLSGTWNEQVGYGLVNAYAAVQAGACPTTNFTNQTVNTNTIIVSNCGDINVQNVSVQNGAKLTLDAAGSTTINAPFEVVLGSELEIK